MKFRTLNDAVAEVKAQDPNSGISHFLIRKMAFQNKIRSLKTGSKLQVDVDSITAYLKGEEYELPLQMLIID